MTPDGLVWTWTLELRRAFRQAFARRYDSAEALVAAAERLGAAAAAAAYLDNDVPVASRLEDRAAAVAPDTTPEGEHHAMTEPMMFRTRPVDVEAMRFDGTAESGARVVEWIRSKGGQALTASIGYGDDRRPGMWVQTATGRPSVPRGWVVVRDIDKGEFSLLQFGVFVRRYEPAEGAPVATGEATP